MKILIIRMIAIEEDCSKETYNNQGIGLATELSKLGHECGLVYYAKRGNSFNEEIERDGLKIKVYHIEGLNIVWNAVYNKSIYAICDRYDIIQVSECDQIFSWMLYKRYPQKTIVYHGPYKSKFTWKYNLRATVFDRIFTWRHGFRNVQVICKSRMAEDYLRKKGFRNIETLGVGLNIGYIDRAVEEESIPERIRNLCINKKDKKYILYIGAISKRKNFSFLIEVLKKLVVDKACKEYVLIVVGEKAYKEDTYYNQCMNLISKYGLENNVEILGTVEQKYLQFIYTVSDTFVLPTQYDIFGMVYLEAMYFGVPVVTTLCGGSSMLIKDGETGFIKNVSDIEGWAEAITYICDNKDQLEEIKRKAKALIREKYLWSSLAPEFERLYKRVLKNG